MSFRSAHKMKVFVVSFLCLCNRNLVQPSGFLPVSPIRLKWVGNKYVGYTFFLAPNMLVIPSSVLIMYSGKKKKKKKNCETP